MIRISLKLAALAATISIGAATAYAKQYVDYTPQKGLWEINAIEVDPNHVDEYLTGLRQSQLPTFEVMKSHGVIDDYRVVVRTGYVKGSPNVLIQVHYPSAAMLDPDKARDMIIDKESNARFSEEQNKAAVANYEKYRTFIDDAMWTDISFAK